MKIKVAKKDFSKEIKHNPSKPNKKEKVQEKVFLSQAVGNKKNTPQGEKKSSLVYLFYFLFIVFAAIGIALVWRGVIIYGQNAFTSSSFSVFVEEAEGESYVISISGDDNIGIIRAPFQGSENESLLKKSYAIGIPIDAEIHASQNGEVGSLFSYQRAVPAFFGASGVRLKEMTVFDFFKAASKVVSIGADRAEEYPSEFEEGSLTLDRDVLMYIFKDPEILDEGLSVEIVNATTFDGLAGKTAQILEPLGVSVVSLASSDPQKQSQIRVRQESVTTERINRLLEIPVVVEPQESIADITIVLGEDFEKKVR